MMQITRITITFGKANRSYLQVCFVSLNQPCVGLAVANAECEERERERFRSQSGCNLNRTLIHFHERAQWEQDMRAIRIIQSIRQTSRRLSRVLLDERRCPSSDSRWIHPRETRRRTEHGELDPRSSSKRRRGGGRGADQRQPRTTYIAARRNRWNEASLYWNVRPTRCETDAPLDKVDLSGDLDDEYTSTWSA